MQNRYHIWIIIAKYPPIGRNSAQRRKAATGHSVAAYIFILLNRLFVYRNIADLTFQSIADQI